MEHTFMFIIFTDYDLFQVLAKFYLYDDYNRISEFPQSCFLHI